MIDQSQWLLEKILIDSCSFSDDLMEISFEEIELMQNVSSFLKNCSFEYDPVDFFSQLDDLLQKIAKNREKANAKEFC